MIQLLTDCSDPVLITSNEIKIVFVNSAWTRLTGYTLKEVQGKNPSILQTGKTPRRVYKAMWRALKNHKSFTTDETIDRGKDGKEFQIHSSIFPVYKNGMIVYFVQIFHDITSKKRLERMQQRFLSAAAHELKTPITVLKLLSQIRLAKATKVPTTANELNELKMMDQEINRMATLVNDLLDSTRIRKNKLILNYEKFDLIKLMKDIIQKMQISDDKHTIMMSEIPKELIVSADPSRIEQVIINLISNAIKYSPGTTVIEIAVHHDKKRVIISIKDKGIGIPVNDQKHIFDIYYQIEKTNHVSRSGFGMGLYLSKEIIKRHKGKLWVESEVGKGSTFSFSIPQIA